MKTHDIIRAVIEISSPGDNVVGPVGFMKRRIYLNLACFEDIYAIEGLSAILTDQIARCFLYARLGQTGSFDPAFSVENEQYPNYRWPDITGEPLKELYEKCKPHLQEFLVKFREKMQEEERKKNENNAG